MSSCQKKKKARSGKGGQGESVGGHGKSHSTATTHAVAIRTREKIEVRGWCVRVWDAWEGTVPNIMKCFFGVWPRKNATGWHKGDFPTLHQNKDGTRSTPPRLPYATSCLYVRVSLVRGWVQAAWPARVATCAHGGTLWLPHTATGIAWLQKRKKKKLRTYQLCGTHPRARQGCLWPYGQPARACVHAAWRRVGEREEEEGAHLCTRLLGDSCGGKACERTPIIAEDVDVSATLVSACCGEASMACFGGAQAAPATTSITESRPIEDPVDRSPTAHTTGPPSTRRGGE